jgi:hypothetical protein
MQCVDSKAMRDSKRSQIHCERHHFVIAALQNPVRSKIQPILELEMWLSAGACFRITSVFPWTQLSQHTRAHKH